MSIEKSSIIIDNRKIIKRLFESDASVFCFFRNTSVNSKEIKYDTLVIFINRNAWQVAIEFRLNNCKDDK